MAEIIDDMLRNKKILFHKDFVCTSQKYTPVEMKDEIIRQLSNYVRIVEVNKNIYEPPKVKYTGKDGYGFDDHVMAIGFVGLVSQRYKYIKNNPELFGGMQL